MAGAHVEEADRLRRALTAEQQRREQAVTAAAVAEQARILADQARAASLGEAERLRGELAELTRALKSAQQQREEAVTAVAVAQALLREKDSTAQPDTSPTDAPSFEQSDQAG
jgi:dihydrodipicolinate synthase/N-acetylneuraminate lyase